VTIKAAAQQTSGVNAAMAYGTDGPVAALGLQTLSDPQGVQPIYAPTPVVREAVLKAYPQIANGCSRSLPALTRKRCNSSMPALPWKGWTRKSCRRLSAAKGLLK
jgi:osmoprotectant transport system substrate-binding protein